MQTNTTERTAGRVDPEELDRHIAEIYRDVANETRRELHFPTGRPLAEALGYPADLLDRLPATAVNSFAGVGLPPRPRAPAPGRARARPGQRLRHGRVRGRDGRWARTAASPASTSRPSSSPSPSACATRRTSASAARASRSCPSRRLVRRRDLERRGQPLGRQAPRVRRGGARAPSRRPRWRSPTSSPSGRSRPAPRARPTSGPPASPGPASQILPGGHRAGGLELQASRPTRPTASRASARSARATSTARTASRCWRSSRSTASQRPDPTRTQEVST